MITLTSAQQAIVKSDSSIKSFRVHFPNGELADLTNEDILFESVKFSESVCSEQTLRFGCAEASYIEFETVGIPNIYGATIECSMTFTLGDDSVTIPYGTFAVTSCPRSAGEMYRRKVQAYTFGGKQLQPSDYVRHLVNTPMSAKLLKLSPVLYLVAAANSDLDLTLTTVSPLSLTTGPRVISTPTWTANGHTYTLTVTGNNPKYGALLPNLHRLTADTVNYSVYQEMFAKMAELGATNEAMKNARNKVLPGYDFVNGGNRDQWPFSDPTGSTYDSGYFFAVNAGIDAYVFVPEAQTAVLDEDGTTIETYNLSGFTTNSEVARYNVSDAYLSSLEMQIEPSFQESTTNLYMYIGAVDFPALYAGFLELMGSFGQIGRDGSAKRITLSKSNPVSVPMSEYAYDNCWWDEYSIEPIGTVRYTYYDPTEETEQTVEYTIGDGLSIYDMTSNELLKLLVIPSGDTLGQTISERIEYLLDAYFKPAVQEIDFVPVDLEMLGLPYLEAGDYLEFDVGNNQTIGTYMLSRSMSGIHQLMDSVESHGGEIISDGGRQA